MIIRLTDLFFAVLKGYSELISKFVPVNFIPFPKEINGKHRETDSRTTEKWQRRCL